MTSYVFDMSIVPKHQTYKQEPKMWAKTIDKVDLTKPGGWSLIGDFINAQHMVLHNGIEYKLKFDSTTLLLNATSSKVIVCCANFEFVKPKRRVAIVLLPANMTINKNQFPNVIARSSQGKTVYRSNITDGNNVMVEIVASVDTDKLIMAVFCDHEGKSGDNSLVDAAKFLDQKVTMPGNVKPTAPKVIVNVDTKESLSTLPLTPSLVPIKEGKLAREARELKISTESKWTVKKKDRLSTNRATYKLPEGIQLLTSADGIKVLFEGDRPRMMHILADYENVHPEIREYMLDQADLLESMAAAYRLVAEMGKTESTK